MLIGPNLSGDCQELFRRQVLVAEEHHAAVEQGAAHFVRVIVLQRRRIDVADFRPDGARDRMDLDRAVAH